MAARPEPGVRRASHVSIRFVLLTGLLWGCATAGFQAPEPAAPKDIPALEASAAATPADVDVRVRLGEAYRAAGRLDDAQRVLLQALAIDPRSGPAISELGVVYDQAGADSSAMAMYRRYLNSYPNGALRSELTQRLDLVRRRALLASVDTALKHEAELASTPPQPRTVGVFPFAYQGSDTLLRPLGRALAEMLTNDLAQSSRLRVVERVRVQLLLDEMALSAKQRVDPATAARSGRLLGAAHVVQGVLDGNESQLVMEAVVVPVGDSASKPGAPLSARDPAQRFYDMETQMALDVFRSLGIQLTTAEREAIGHKPTENLNALLSFGLGLEAEDAGRYQEAARHFADAARLDPNFHQAAAMAQQSQSMIVAEAMNLGDLARAGLAGLNNAEAAYDQWLNRLSSFTDIERLLPGLQGRDAVSELLGREGLGTSGSTVNIIFRRPGGDQ